MSSLLDWLKCCTVCPNSCRIDRTAGRTGRCRVDDGIVISSSALHFGEEPCLVGTGGSGTVFMTACNLACIYCQNYEISQLDRGARVTTEELVRIMRDLERRGAENINLVSPTHQAPQIFDAVQGARIAGVRIPIVYNSGGYENPDFLRELAGLVDIYMPDFKYGRNEDAQRYSDAREYATFCRASIREMHRQVGDLALDSRGVAQRGLLVRHLVLPRGLAGSCEVIDFLASEISPHTYLNVMDQYHPCFRADSDIRLRRRVTRSEVEGVVAYARNRGMKRVLS